MFVFICCKGPSGSVTESGVATHLVSMCSSILVSWVLVGACTARVIFGNLATMSLAVGFSAVVVARIKLWVVTASFVLFVLVGRWSRTRSLQLGDLVLEVSHSLEEVGYLLVGGNSCFGQVGNSGLSGGVLVEKFCVCDCQLVGLKFNVTRCHIVDHVYMCLVEVPFEGFPSLVVGGFVAPFTTIMNEAAGLGDVVVCHANELSTSICIIPIKSEGSAVINLFE